MQVVVVVDLQQVVLAVMAAVQLAVRIMELLQQVVVVVANFILAAAAQVVME